MTVSDTVVSFKCKAVGDPTPSIQWRKNSKPLPNDGRHIVRNDGTLDIVRPTVADEGTYECLAQNDAGEELAEAALRYQGVEGKEKLSLLKREGQRHAHQDDTPRYTRNLRNIKTVVGVLSCSRADPD